MGVITKPLMHLHCAWDEFFANNSVAKCFVTCHSQGAIHLKNALLSYPVHLRKRILVVAIAPARYIDPALCGKVVHYRAKWWRDLIPYIFPFLFDYDGMKKAEGTIITLESHPDAPLNDHGFGSPTFEDPMETHTRTYHNSDRMEI